MVYGWGHLFAMLGVVECAYRVGLIEVMFRPGFLQKGLFDFIIVVSYLSWMYRE
jgi:hypothetical protein